eukprot:TRINITY_DN80500_c0_g1_i1.p1 TRINITY_DN80500_c0_g1~~TRINITY_DN80500_c0_g1_i1.p1  ORF type:complete len:324 (-),score=38.29 TRINITY_DN80500_c0_g1_i1:177-1148(-)
MRYRNLSHRLIAWYMSVFILCVNAYDDDEDYKDDTKACRTWYPKAVENICHSNFPEATSDTLWIMLFSSHACHHCSSVVKGFANIAKMQKNNPGVRVGVVNCYYAKNYRELCLPHKVDALPTLRIIDNGKFDVPRMPRHTMAEIDQLVNEAMSSRTCPEAVPGSSRSAVPLCRMRYPSSDTNSRWLVLFYSKENAGPPLSIAEQVSVELGNAGGTEKTSDWSDMTKRDRLLAIKGKYSLSIDLPGEGPFGKRELVKVGTMCCDCNSEQQAFCSEKLGADNSLPVVAWFEEGVQRETERMQDSASGLMEYAMSQLGLIDSRGEL